MALIGDGQWEVSPKGKDAAPPRPLNQTPAWLSPWASPAVEVGCCKSPG